GHMELFEAIHTARAIRRFRPDPVADELILQIVEAGTMAPSATNAQPWAFVVVRDPETKRFVQERYAKTFHAAYAQAKGLIDRAASGDPSRLLAAATWLADHLHEVPVLLFCCVERYGAQRPGREREPRNDSIFPAVQNILLACRGLGLGACLTTLHTVHEREIHERLGVPDAYASPAMIPIGYPLDRHGPIRRRPAREVTYRERWGQELPPSK
ncbi:MAG: nitroreductase family protein, partial [Candidatus Binatia bacterium]